MKQGIPLEMSPEAQMSPVNKVIYVKKRSSTRLQYICISLFTQSRKQIIRKLEQNGILNSKITKTRTLWRKMSQKHANTQISSFLSRYTPVSESFKNNMARLFFASSVPANSANKIELLLSG